MHVELQILLILWPIFCEYYYKKSVCENGAGELRLKSISSSGFVYTKSFKIAVLDGVSRIFMSTIFAIGRGG